MFTSAHDSTALSEVIWLFQSGKTVSGPIRGAVNQAPFLNPHRPYSKTGGQDTWWMARFQDTQQVPPLGSHHKLRQPEYLPETPMPYLLVQFCIVHLLGTDQRDVNAATLCSDCALLLSLKLTSQIHNLRITGANAKVCGWPCMTTTTPPKSNVIDEKRAHCTAKHWKYVKQIYNIWFVCTASVSHVSSGIMTPKHKCSDALSLGGTVPAKYVMHYHVACGPDFWHQVAPPTLEVGRGGYLGGGYGGRRGGGDTSRP